MTLTVQITVIETIWSIASLAGFATTLWLLREALSDRKALIAASRNGPGLLLASGLVRNELLRAAQLLAMSMLGLFALVGENPNQAEAFHISAGWALTMIALAITTNALLDRQMRLAVSKEILEIYERGETYRGIRPPESD